MLLKSGTLLEPVANALKTLILSMKAKMLPLRRASEFRTRQRNGASASPWLMYVCLASKDSRTD
eukprot:6496169-Karenia_brevis.AAC.1